MSPVLLHAAGGASGTASLTVVAFVFIFAMSFAFGKTPEGSGKMTFAYVAGWFRASLPRLAVAGAFSGLVFLGASQLGHSGADTALCDQSLPPLSQAPVTGERLQGAVAALRQVTTAAAAGDEATAISLFSGDAHNVTHDIDGPLRAADAALARELCRNVVALENEFAGTPRLDVVADKASAIAGLLVEAGRELGLME